MRVKLLAPFYKGLLFLMVIPLAAQTSSSNVIALDEIELRPVQIRKLLKEHLVRHETNADAIFTHVRYKEILSSSHGSKPLVSERELVLGLDLRQPLDYPEAFHTSFWLLSERCVSLSTYTGPFPDIDFSARTFQMSYYVTLVERFFDHLVVRQTGYEQSKRLSFYGTAQSGQMRLEGSLIFYPDGEIKQLEVQLSFAKVDTHNPLQLHIINTYLATGKLKSQRMKTMILGEDTIYTQEQLFEFQERFHTIDPSFFQIPLDTSYPVKLSCYGS